MNGADVDQAFRISLLGAATAVDMGRKNVVKEIKIYFDNIKGLMNGVIKEMNSICYPIK